MLYCSFAVGWLVLLWLKVIVFGQHDCQVSQNLQNLCALLALPHQQHDCELVWRERELLKLFADVVDDPLEDDLVLGFVHFRQNVHELVKYLKRRSHFDSLVRKLLIDNSYFYQMLELNVFLQREVKSVLVERLWELNLQLPQRYQLVLLRYLREVEKANLLQHHNSVMRAVLSSVVQEQNRSPRH